MVFNQFCEKAFSIKQKLKSCACGLSFHCQLLSESDETENCCFWVRQMISSDNFVGWNLEKPLNVEFDDRIRKLVARLNIPAIRLLISCRHKKRKASRAPKIITSPPIIIHHTMKSEAFLLSTTFIVRLSRAAEKSTRRKI